MASYKYTDELEKKILDALENAEWMPAIDIAHWAEIKPRRMYFLIDEAVKRGKVEKNWDGNLGITYYRKKV